MRSQASKPLSKKGALGKTTFKANAATKQTKKKTSPKKIKTLQKSLSKGPKKDVSSDDVTKGASEGESSTTDKVESKSEVVRNDSPKTIPSRENSPTKKTRKEVGEKKDKAKVTCKKVVAKKTVKKLKKAKLNPKLKSNDKDSDDIKYKINVDGAKKGKEKLTKTKSNIKKANTLTQKKIDNEQKNEKEKQDMDKNGEVSSDPKISKVSDADNKTEKSDSVLENKDKKKETVMTPEKNQEKSVLISSQNSSINNTPKIETERPPKFFTSIRSPRTVDIDVKCCKNSKGNLSVSERFLSMKCETKVDDSNKEKNLSNNLVSQGPEIDVYTFTEKVDSPKSILSDFRSPINKNIGRVRPIARVKGTVIDRKTDLEKKKYSPHRPIEEVVKQLKAKNRSDDPQFNINDYDTLDLGLNMLADRDSDEKPKPIVSKSYKMVARKSSITGKPFSPIKFLDQEPLPSKLDVKTPVKGSIGKKCATKTKKQNKKNIVSDEEMNTSTFSFSNKPCHYSSSDESVSESNDDNDTKDSSGSDNFKIKRTRNKKYKRITDSAKKSTSKELKELSKDSLIDLKDASTLLGNEKPSKRRLKLLSMWSGPKKHRMASLNALAKVHCLYENESRSHMELGLMKTVDRQVMPGTSKQANIKKKETKSRDHEKQDSTSESEYDNKKDKEKDSSESSDDNPPQRSLRGEPGIRSAGKYWDPKSSTSSSDDSELEFKTSLLEKKKTAPKASSVKPDNETIPSKMKKTAGVPVKKKRNRNEVVMDLKDMVVQKRMASLNATAILAASYEKRSPKSSKEDTTSDSCSDESFIQKPKNGLSSGVKSEIKNEDTKKESEDLSLPDSKQKVEVIVNQDTDVTITGVYATHHHEGFCTVSGMQYRISSTSHTQTTATANCEKEGCSREDGARYTPLTALSSMKPPADHPHSHPHPVPELGGLGRRPGCSSAFSAPSPAAHHDPGYYQPAGPLIKESGAEAERALARYHPPPHYHSPHPPMLQQYGPPYYSAELCYGRYYRPPGSYHIPPPQPDGQMVGVGSEPYPPQYYGSSPCYQHSPQRIPYVEYRGCPCPLNACPKNVLIGPATGKAPAGGGPADVSSSLAPPGGSFRPKVRACVLDSAADTHGSGKDPPLEPEPLEPPTAADAPHQCPLPAIGGASPKRELYDVRESLRLNADIPEPTEAIGPPSPARGACAPQPTPSAPRRARLGKAMARRSLAGDDTAALLNSGPNLPLTSQSDADDDVLAISPPVCVPIDLSSSDERSTPLVDIKKENEGPTYTTPRKADAQALREHNCTTALSDTANVTDSTKPIKRRYSKSKLEIEMKDVQLTDVCKTNCIGEHVKLQKRRKVSSDQIDAVRVETITKEPKKKATQSNKKTQKLSLDKKTHKRKSETIINEPKAKKSIVESSISDDPRLENVAAVVNEDLCMKPKTKSAVLLDNLLRKNSIDRQDAKGYSSDINPAELFLTSHEDVAESGRQKSIINDIIVSEICKKNIIYSNNKMTESNAPTNGVRPKTIAAVSQLIEKKLAFKNKMVKINSNITHSLKSVLTSPTNTTKNKEDQPLLENGEANIDKSLTAAPEKNNLKLTLDKEKNESAKENSKCASNIENSVKIVKPMKQAKSKTGTLLASKIESIKKAVSKDSEQIEVSNEAGEPKCMFTEKPNGEAKTKNVEKVVKLLVSKKPVLKCDEASLVMESACEPARGPRRRRSGVRRRRLAAPSPPLPMPRAPPRWSNGWNWDGDHYLAKVYLNNDTRLDRVARCWARMTHASGDYVSRGDCVLLRASPARAQPFVARVASLWENPDDGEMMVSLVWYYRPEHTARGRGAADAADEVFASGHRDANSVACIEDKCYVLTYNEYCRYKKRLRAIEEGITIAPSLVPPLPASELAPALAPNDTKLPPAVSPELVLFCRKIYDFRSKKIQVK